MLKNLSTLFQTVFKKQRENRKRKRNFHSWSKLSAESLTQCYEAFQNQILPNEYPSFYPVNYYSHNSCDSRNRSNWRSQLSPYRSSHFGSHSMSRLFDKYRSRYRCHTKNSTLTELHYFYGALNFFEGDDFQDLFNFLLPKRIVTALF